MADKKKMSIEEILAAARAADKGGSAPPPSTEEEAPAASDPSEASAPASAKKPAAAAGKPAAGKKPTEMSVAEMLAAARAEKEGGAKAAPAAKPAKPKAAAEKPAAKAAAAEKPAAKTAAKPAGPKDTASILAAARTSAKPGPISKAEAAARGAAPEKGGKQKLEVPPMPAKPAYARASAPAAAPAGSDRRSFFAAVAGVFVGSSLAVGFSTLVLTNLLWVLGLARFMFPNILTEPPTKFKVGFPDELAPGQVETKYIPEFGVWVVRYEYDGQPQIYALQSVCTHLGCTPNWLEGEQKFKCPCHGSGFYKDGINFEGPAPRPLERFAIRLADDGQLEVDKSRKFKEEIGQWRDPASYVPV